MAKHLNENNTIRCRSMLAPYVDQTLILYGKLDMTSNNQRLFDRINHERNALFVEVHTIEITKTNQPLFLDLEHIHCVIHSQHLKKQTGQYQMFKAKVIKYEAFYQTHMETRYGLTDYEPVPMDKNQIYSLNQKYRNQLTLYETALVYRIKQLLQAHKPKKRDIVPNDILIPQLLKQPTIINRTDYLMSVHHELVIRKQLSRTRMEFFTMSKYDLITDQVNDLKQQNSDLTNQIHQLNVKLTAYNHHESPQLQQANQKIQQLENMLANRTKNISFWRWIKIYFRTRHHHLKQINAEKPTISESELHKLKHHFDKRKN